MRYDGYISYWRTTGGQEVDFIIKNGQNIIPIEVTYSVMTERKKIKNLMTFMHEERCAYGLYFYRGEFKIDKENNIYFIPVWAIIQ